VQGGSCACLEGFEEKNGTCTDVNECTEWGFCDQNCENSEGSFKCSCVKGYNPVKRRKKTVCEPDETSDILFAHQDTIFRVSGIGTGIKVQVRY